MNEIRLRVEGVFKILFPNAAGFSDDTSSRDIHAWDSLNHIVLISKIEGEFSIKFELDEILTMQSFGEICSGVEKKLNS